MSTLCRSRIDSLIQTHLGPWAKTAGFKKKGTKWNRRADGFVDVVDLQASQWNDDVTCNVTVNLGVFVPSIYERCWGQPPAFVAETDCIVRVRLSALLQDVPRSAAVDKWWDVSSPPDAGRSIVSALSGAALTFFEHMHSVSAVRDELEAAMTGTAVQPATLLYLALLKSDMGDTAGSERIMSNFDHPNLHAWQDRAARVRQYLKQ